MKTVYFPKPLLAAVALLFAGAAQADGLKLGALMPMTGGLGAYGESSLNGVKLAIDEINRAGGVNGAKVTLSVGDTQTAPQAGVDAAKKLVEIEKVSGLIGALSSGVTIPVAATVSSTAGVPQISSASTSPEITGLKDRDFLFRTVPTDAIQGVALAQLVKSKKLTSVAIVYVNNDYGKGLAESFSKSFEVGGGKVVSSVAFEQKQASYRGELQKAARGGAQALLLISYPEDGIPILKQSLQGGFFSKFVFTDGMKAPEIIKSIGAKYLNGSFATAPQAAGEGSRRFKKAYEKKFGQLPPKPFIDSAYDATILLALAAEKAGSNDPKALRDALRAVANPPGETVLPGEFARAKKLIAAGKDMDYVGASGPQNFDAAGDVAGTYAHWEIQKGKIVTIRVFEPNTNGP
jgi:ABC-type branched-subunit amino acid transport system substrate-binding protein